MPDPFRDFAQKMKDEAEAILAANPPAPPPAPVPVPPPPAPVGALPVAENIKFTLTAPTLVRFGTPTGSRWVQKSLPVGEHACVAATFGQGDPAFGVVKRCESLGAPPIEPPAPPPPPAPVPPPPAPPPAPVGPLFDAQGNVIPAAYLSFADSMGTKAGVQNLYGSPGSVADTGLPDAPEMTRHQWSPPGPAYRPGTFVLPDQPGEVAFGPNPDFGAGGAGAFESNGGMAASIDDDANGTGLVELSLGNVSGPKGVLGMSPEYHWALPPTQATGVNAEKFKAQGKVIKNMVAIARGDGQEAWDLQGVGVTRGGAVITSVTNTAMNAAFAQLPAHLAPTSIAWSNANECIVIGCMDRTTYKAKLAFIACVGLGAGATLANPDSHPAPEYPTGHWGNSRQALPYWPSIGDIAYMKYVGEIEIPGMHVPTGVAFTTGKNGASDAVPWTPEANGGPGYMGHGSDIVSMAQRTPLHGTYVDNGVTKLNRDDWKPSGGGAYDALSHGGLIVVISGPEQSVAFVDATPIWRFVEKMQLTTDALYQQTRDVGDGAKWPFMFDAAPEQKPTVIKVVSLGSTPRCVMVGKWGPRRAYIGTADGKVIIFNTGDYPTKANGVAGNPASIVKLGEIALGGNITGISRPREHAAFNLYPNGIMGELIVTDREGRQVPWVRLNAAGTGGSVVRTLRDKRLKDPIRAIDVGNHSSGYHVLFVADYGKGNSADSAIHGYPYGPVKLQGEFANQPQLNLVDGTFRYTGGYKKAGAFFDLNGCNIP